MHQLAKLLSCCALLVGCAAAYGTDAPRDQLERDRTVEGIHADEPMSNVTPEIGLGMPKQWNLANQIAHPSPGTVYEGQGGFWQSGADYLWFKMMYGKEQSAHNIQYTSVVMLIKFLCDKMQFAVVEDYRYSKDGQLVSKVIYPKDKQMYHPIRFDKFPAVDHVEYNFAAAADSANLCSTDD